MPKFKIGETVQIKKKHLMTGYIGIVVAYQNENHTYLVRFSHDQVLIFLEEELAKMNA